MLDGLHANTTLRTLELSDNGVGEQTICLLKKVVGREQVSDLMASDSVLTATF